MEAHFQHCLMFSIHEMLIIKSEVKPSCEEPLLLRCCFDPAETKMWKFHHAEYLYCNLKLNLAELKEAVSVLHALLARYQQID